MDTIYEQARKLLPYAVEQRRYFHENPELSGLEFDTMSHIAGELKAMGIPFVYIPDGGLLGHIDGGQPGGSVLLRADCDALPITEDTCNNKGPKPCVSKRAGLGHMCGHDAHMAMLLAAAKLLLERRSQLRGRVWLLFERGEEGTNNIYWVMRYLFENKIAIDGALGLHVDGGIPSGQIAFRPGPVSAGAGGYLITLTGQGGHGSRPDESNNPIDCFVAIYNQLKVIRIRHIQPFTPFTDGVGVVQSGTKGNVIPNDLRFSGTFRFFDMEAGQTYYDKLCSIVEHTAAEYGCTVTYNMLIGPSYPVVNDSTCCTALGAALDKALPAGLTVEADMQMGSESFATFGAYYPAVYARVGTSNPGKGTDTEAHHPAFDIDEDAMVSGITAHAAFAQEFLSGGYKPEFTPCTDDIDTLTKKTHMVFPPRKDGIDGKVIL